MKIVVLGLWHLGCVTAASAAKFESVVGLDSNPAVVRQLQNGNVPLFEPDLEPLIKEGLQSNRLTFSDDPAVACQDADLLWVCYDTPVDDNDATDIAPVVNGIKDCVPHLPSGSLVLISAQVPAGTCRSLEARFPGYRFAYCPENLRLGKAVSVFLSADRIILGVRNARDAEELMPLLTHFTQNLIVVGIESAEMIKHAINSFLANSIAFMNEVSRICEYVGADAKEVERGLKSERRIGPGAYLSPGGSFAGGTLARDVVALSRLAEEGGEPLILVPAIKQSNDEHKHWAAKRLQEELGNLVNRSIAVLGLTYKPGTDTLRRSLAIELCRELLQSGAKVQAYDPVVRALPDDLNPISLSSSLEQAVYGCEAIVVCTAWPEIQQADWNKTSRRLGRMIVVDANGVLASVLDNQEGIVYRRVGKPRSA